MKRVSVILSTLFVLGLFLVSAGGAYGQFYPGRVTGTVTDSSGALVPGADVKLTQCCLDGHHCCEFQAVENETPASAVG